MTSPSTYRFSAWRLNPRQQSYLMALSDAGMALLAAAGALAAWGWIGHGTVAPAWIARRFLWIPILTLLWLASLSLAGAYRPSLLYRRPLGMRTIFAAIALLLGIYLTVYFFSPRTLLPRLVVLAFAGIAGWMTAASRFFWARWRTREGKVWPVVIVGTGKAKSAVTALLQERSQRRYQIVGFIGKNARALPGLVQRTGAAEIILAGRMQRDPALVEILARCRAGGVAVTRALDFYEDCTGRVPLDLLPADLSEALPQHLGATAVLYRTMKRLMDIIGALTGLAIFLPFLPILGLLIRLDSPGPIFYRQKRVGLGGRIFTLWKLRTMRVDAEAGGRAVWAQKNDPRVTRVGGWLRRFRIDEFPQFWNILRGDMAAVGPRPERPEFERRLSRQIPFYPLRHTVPPGMSGWAVIHHDYVDSPQEARTRLEYDLYYVKHRSLWLDLQILVQGVVELLSRRGRT